MSSQKPLQNRSYYLEALQRHRRTVALIIAIMVTAPLFAFTSLPPVEVLEKVPQEVTEQIPVLVNKTVEVEVNVTEEVILNRTIGVNITEGGNIFLEPQPVPPLIGSDIVLCIDTSLSMEPENMPIAKIAIKNFIELLNKSFNAGISNDRIALISFTGSDFTTWSDHATVHTELEYVSNQTHLELVLNETDLLSGSGGTDIWAGLNKSLDILFGYTRPEPSLKSIFLLTDGLHQSGPWDNEVEDKDYDGFMTLPSNEAPYSQSPIVVARENNVKICTIGLFEGATYGFDENFLRNISLNVTHGTFADFFAGNDTLSLSEGFLQARDSASGWTLVNSSDIMIVENNSQSLFSYNVTQEVRRLKWDLNWNNTGIDFNLTVTDSNGSIIHITDLTKDNMIPVTLGQPKSVIFDYPSLGVWEFNITVVNQSSLNEPIMSRLSSYEPPIFIESIRQFDPTAENQSLLFDVGKSCSTEIRTISDGNLASYNILKLLTNETFSNQSVLFLVNVTNKNPLFTYHNITVYVLGNFTSYNISMIWTPASIDSLGTGNYTEFLFNLTFNEPAFLQGIIFFKVNCSEGFHDAVAQEVSLDYRIITQNVTIETYFENRTILVIENQTILTTILSQSIRTQYAYDHQFFNTLKWGGFFVTFGLLFSFLAVYVAAHAYQLRNLAKSFRTRLFPDQTILELALQKEGISVAPEQLSAIIESTDDLDQFGENIFNLTGKKLTPEDLIRLTSGVSTDQIISRLSFVTGRSPDEISALLSQTPSIEALITQLSLDEKRFLDIITRDEQVLSFQSKIASLITPMQKEVSQIILNDDLDISKFRSRLKNKSN